MTELVTRRVCLLGFGNVGRRLCELVARNDHELAERHGLRLRFVAIGTAGHGSLLAPAGVSAAEALELGGGAEGARRAFPEPARLGVDLLAASGADVLVEATPLDPHGGRLAIAHLEAALEHGADAITVNKGPIAWDYRRLADLAAAHGRRLLFEGAVMDGCPVFSLFRSTLPDCRLLGFEAVFNSTTNFILDAMGEGGSFAAALAQVQAAGYAEADPSHDIDGHDAAAKVAALANVLMDAGMTPDDVPKDSIRDVSPERVVAARRAGRRLRVVCTGRRGDGAGSAGGGVAGAGGSAADGGPAQPAAGSASGRVSGAVRLTELDADHPLFSAGGSTLSVLLHTDLMQTVQIAEIGALPEQTAYGIYSDLIALHEGR